MHLGMPSPNRPIYYKAHPGNSMASLGRMWESPQSTQPEGPSNTPWTWAAPPYFLSPLVLNFGYLFYRRNNCVYRRTSHVLAQHVLRGWTHWLVLRTIGQLIVQEQKLCFLVKCVKVLTRTSDQYNHWLKYSFGYCFCSPHFRFNSLLDISGGYTTEAGNSPCDLLVPFQL